MSKPVEGRLAAFERKFFPLRGLLLFAPLIAAWYLFIQKDTKAIPLDLTVYRRAADFIATGQSPYGFDFTTQGFSQLPWVYTPFGTLLVAPLHYVPLDWLFTAWTVTAIALPLIVLTLLGYQAFLRRPEYSRSDRLIIVAVFTLLASLTGPVLDAYSLGQIGVLLAALTLYDLAAPDSWFRFKKLSLPRGVLAGIAGAIKLVPLIAIPYWVITRQWKPAITATLTVAVTWTLAFIALPGPSTEYFSKKLFLGTNSVSHIRYEDNQSLIAVIQRLTNTFPLPTNVWVPIAAVVALLGLWAARATYRNGDILSAGIIVGLTSVLASPVSWIHHIAWLVAVPGALLAGRALRNTNGRISKAGWLWLGAVLVIAIPPVKYSWSPLDWIGITEQYNVLSIALIAWLWLRSRNSLKSPKLVVA